MAAIRSASLAFVAAFTPSRITLVYHKGTRLNTKTTSLNHGRRLMSTSSSCNEIKVARNVIKNPIIIGGGIAGLATAAALQNIANISSFRVLEKSSSASFYQDEGVGAGAQLGPNGLRALRAIGSEDLMRKVMASGSKLEGNAMVMPGGAGPMFMPDMTEVNSHDGLPQVFVRWSVLRKFLREMIPEENIITGVGGDIAGYTVDEKDESVTVVTKDGKNHIVSAFSSSLIVGADGATSTCRHWVQSGSNHVQKYDGAFDNDDLKDTGRVNIKAVVPHSLDEKSFKPGFTYAFFAAKGGIGCFAGPAGEGHTYWAVSIADEKNDDTGEATPFLSLNFNDVDDFEGIHVKSTLLSKLASLNTDDCKFAMDMIELSDPDTIYVTRSKELKSIGPSLASDDGKVVLVGDAAHAMSGSYGQNPNFALEGAAELATCIRDHDGDSMGSSSSGIQAALTKYSSLRVDRCIEMQRRSAERAEKAMRGEKELEDVSKWIFQWDLNKD